MWRMQIRPVQGSQAVYCRIQEAARKGQRCHRHVHVRRRAVCNMKKTTLKFECEDQYEAEKLTSLLSVQKDNTVWALGVDAVVGNEVVIRLKDRSSHAVMLKDEQTVVRLKSFMTDLMKGKIKIDSSESLGSVTEIRATTTTIPD